MKLPLKTKIIKTKYKFLNTSVEEGLLVEDLLLLGLDLTVQFLLLILQIRDLHPQFSFPPLGPPPFVQGGHLHNSQ